MTFSNFQFELFKLSKLSTSQKMSNPNSFAKLIIRHGRRPLGTINGIVERDGLILPLFLLAHFSVFFSLSLKAHDKTFSALYA